MIDIPMKSSEAVTRDTVLSINQKKVQGATDVSSVLSLNRTTAGLDGASNGQQTNAGQNFAQTNNMQPQGNAYGQNYQQQPQFGGNAFSQQNMQPGYGAGQYMNTQPAYGAGQQMNTQPAYGAGQQMNTQPAYGAGQQMNTQPAYGAGQQMNTQPAYGAGQQMNTQPAYGAGQQMNTQPTYGAGQQMNAQPAYGAGRQMNIQQPNAPVNQMPQQTPVQQPVPQQAPVQQSTSAAQPQLKDMALPNLVNSARKGQKLALEGVDASSKINVCLGWNVNNSECDVDVSAFILNNNKVISDDWFVFYGQKTSPDGSLELSLDAKDDREIVSIDFSKLNPQVDKIVFVLTINEALDRNLNFSMVKDAYIRIMNSSDNSEIVSFMMDEYYENVTSMMIGEIYKYNDSWKFNAVGNGVARDLAGLCELYGVNVD